MWKWIADIDDPYWGTQYFRSPDASEINALETCDRSNPGLNFTNFDHCVDGRFVTSYGAQYDYTSVMHYRMWSSDPDPNKRNNMVPLKNVDISQIGQRVGLSSGKLFNLDVEILAFLVMI